MESTTTTTTTPKPPIKIIKRPPKPPIIPLSREQELRDNATNSANKLTTDIAKLTAKLTAKNSVKLAADNAEINARYDEIESRERETQEMAMAEDETRAYAERIERAAREMAEGLAAMADAFAREEPPSEDDEDNEEDEEWREVLNADVDKCTAQRLLSEGHTDEYLRNLSINKEITPIVALCYVGSIAEEIYPQGYRTGDFVNIYSSKFRQVPGYHKKGPPTDKDRFAAIRASLYTSSPSSATYHTKRGIVVRCVQAPLFVNVNLANLNGSYGWKKSCAGQGRSKNGGVWKFIPNLDLNNWDEASCGNLPTQEQLNQSLINKKKGSR